MRYWPKRARSTRFVLVCLAVGATLLAGAAIAIAAYPQDSVTVYTGCLSTAGSGGNISSVAVGSSPTKPCGPNALLIHLSGGTITQVSAGAGLTGGGDNGYVTIGLDPKYTLPQNSCAAGQFVASDGSGGWSCADDQTYTNGTGLNLTGNTFSVGSGYQLPQGCTTGQVAASNGNGGWTCHSSVGSLSTYSVTGNDVTVGDPLDITGDTESSYATCSIGDYLIGGGSYTDHVDQIYNGPGGPGWQVRGSTGPFSEGHVQAIAMCLHTG